MKFKHLPFPHPEKLGTPWCTCLHYRKSPAMYTYTKILTVASPCITVLDHESQQYVTTVNVVVFIVQ